MRSRTTSSIVRGPSFDLFHEGYEEDETVYLELTGVRFEARLDRVTVALPVGVWEFVRQFAALDLSLADATDGDLRARAERDADEREALLADADGPDPLFIDIRFIHLGDPEAPRAEQVAAGVEDYERRRARQRAVREAVARVAAESTPSRPPEVRRPA